MQEFGQDPRGSDGPSGSWSAADLRLDAAAAPLIRRLLVDDDAGALPELVDLLGPRLAALADALLSEHGVCATAELDSDWFAHLLDADGRDVPEHPLGAAHAWMDARARSLAIGLSAQPMPWEEGYDRHLPSYWRDQLGVATDDPRGLYVTLCAVHRCELATRQVLRDVQVLGLESGTCAERRGLTVAVVQEHLRTARLAIIRALERAEEGGADD